MYRIMIYTRVPLWSPAQHSPVRLTANNASDPIASFGLADQTVSRLLTLIRLRRFCKTNQISKLDSLDKSLIGPVALSRRVQLFVRDGIVEKFFQFSVQQVHPNIT